MKYYYKLFTKEGVEGSLKSIKAPESFIKELKESSSFKSQLEQNMEEFYIGYDVDQIRRGKPAWTWCSVKDYYRVNWNFKGEVRPTRSEKINKLKMLWNDEEL